MPIEVFDKPIRDQSAIISDAERGFEHRVTSHERVAVCIHTVLIFIASNDGPGSVVETGFTFKPVSIQPRNSFVPNAGGESVSPRKRESLFTWRRLRGRPWI